MARNGAAEESGGVMAGRSSSLRIEDGENLAVSATVVQPTTVVSKTAVGNEIRAAVSSTLIRFKTKRIESAGNLTDEGVRLLKLGKRTPSLETAVLLARSGGELGPAMWGAICELCGRPGGEMETPRQVDTWAVVHMLAQQPPGPVQEFAAAMLRMRSADQ